MSQLRNKWTNSSKVKLWTCYRITSRVTARLIELSSQLRTVRHDWIFVPENEQCFDWISESSSVYMKKNFLDYPKPSNSPEKIVDLTGGLNPRLRETGRVLYQLSYRVNWEQCARRIQSKCSSNSRLLMVSMRSVFKLLLRSFRG